MPLQRAGVTTSPGFGIEFSRPKGKAPKGSTAQIPAVRFRGSSLLLLGSGVLDRSAIESGKGEGGLKDWYA